ncbi:CaiB/BaiF CoA-transferase family protein [Ferroplasma sp.]|uniref:CaiB/BaiF CoA transferase family protein n=1 Tax=Ferroplasma sp. TaxID=2591003 RepID=UPI00307DFCE0
MKRVIELGQIVAGPTAGLIFSDMGFEVIKIEKPGNGDISRELGGTSAGTFMYYNRGKKSLELDIKTETGKEVLKKLLKTADIVIENMAPGKMAKLGFSYEEVKNINSRIIYISIKGYMDGPYKDRKTLDYPVEIESGLAYMTGLDGKPMRMGASIVDMAAAMLAAVKAFQLISQNKPGLVEIGLFETAMFLVGQHIATYQLIGHDLPPINERNFAWGIYDYFTTSDNKEIFIAVTTDDQWKNFCAGFNMNGLFENKQFSTNNGRYENRDFLIPAIKKKLLSMTYAKVKKILELNNISYGTLNRPWDLLHDPQALKYMVNMNFDNANYKVPELPFSVSENNNAPLLGNCNKEILTELGYTAGEIDKLIGNH